MNSGIYIIENKINGMKYVGQSQDLNRRMWESHTGCTYLLRAFDYYGMENFDRYVIEYCNPEFLNEREVYYIKELKSHVSQSGYNISWGGDAPMRGRKHTKETKLKLGILSAGNKNPLFNVRLFGKENPFFGKSHTKETNEINRKAHLGKKNGGASRYYGVSRQVHSETKIVYWYAHIRINNKNNHIGCFRNQKSAAIAFDIFILYNKLDLEFNFPDSRQTYIDYLNQFEITDIKDLRKIIKQYLSEQEV